MHKAVRIIFLLQSPVATTPYHRKIKSYSSSDEKNFSLLSWENLNSSCELFWVQAVSTSPVDTTGLCINNWAQGARIPMSWQVAFTLKIKKNILILAQCLNDSEPVFTKQNISKTKILRGSLFELICRPLTQEEQKLACKFIWLPDAKLLICKMFWGY